MSQFVKNDGFISSPSAKGNSATAIGFPDITTCLNINLALPESLPEPELVADNIQVTLAIVYRTLFSEIEFNLWKVLAPRLYDSSSCIVQKTLSRVVAAFLVVSLQISLPC